MYESGELLFWMPGQWEVLLVGGLIVLIFFGRRIPDVMRSLGRGVTQFRKGLRDVDKEAGGGSAAKKEALPAPKAAEGDAGADTKTEKAAGAGPAPDNAPGAQKDGPSGSSSG